MKWQLTKIEKNYKYNGYRLYFAGKVFEFLKYVWKDEDKTEEGMKEMHIVTYNFLFPGGGFNLNSVWNGKKGDYWEKDGKKYYFDLTKNTLVLGKFSLTWSLSLDKNENLMKER